MAVFHIQIQGLYAALGVDFQHILFGDAPLIDILAHTADAIAAHFGAGTVGVVQIHFRVSVFAGLNEDDPVAADTEMPVAETHGQSCRVFHLLFKAVDIDIIVADALHLGKAHGITLLLESF